LLRFLSFRPTHDEPDQSQAGCYETESGGATPKALTQFVGWGSQWVDESSQDEEDKYY
jgi:hypothetical protein